MIRPSSMAVTLTLTVVGLAACSSASDVTSEAPVASRDGVGALQTYSPPGTTMTMNAGMPAPDSLATDSINYADGHVQGTMSWTGSGTYPTGACLLNEVMVNNSPVTCTSASSCAQYQQWTSGAAYCLAPNNGTAKTCWVRPGSQAAFCTGTPADGKQVTVPATKTTPWVDAYSYYTFYEHTEQWEGYDEIAWGDHSYAVWMLEGCYQACASTAPSASSAMYVESYIDWSYNGGPWVQDYTGLWSN